MKVKLGMCEMYTRYLFWKKYKDNIYNVETKNIRDYMLIYAFSKITPSIVYFCFKLIHSVQNEPRVVLQKTLTHQ